MSEVKRYEVTEMGPTYHKRTEMLLSDDGCWVDYEDYAALKAERDALAAENVAARNAVQTFCDVVGSNTDAICEEVGQEGVKVILSAMKATGNMPATDAYLNSVRAEGVEAFAHQQRVIADSLSGDVQRSHRITACRAEDFANQIRAGKDGE